MSIFGKMFGSDAEAESGSKKFEPAMFSEYSLQESFTKLVPDLNINKDNILEIVKLAELTEAEARMVEEAFNQGTLEDESAELDLVRQKVAGAAAIVNSPKIEN
jgi:hypothetical protein